MEQEHHHGAGDQSLPMEQEHHYSAGQQSLPMEQEHHYGAAQRSLPMEQEHHYGAAQRSLPMEQEDYYGARQQSLPKEREHHYGAVQKSLPKEREHHYGAGQQYLPMGQVPCYSGGLSNDQERAAFQAAINAEMYSRNMRPYQSVPVYGYPFQAMRGIQYYPPRHATPPNFSYNNTCVNQGLMAGGRFMPPRHPGLNILPPQLLHQPPRPLLPQWQMMHGARQDMEQAHSMPGNISHGPNFAGGAYFGGRHAPSSGIQTTGPSQRAGVFQHRMMGDDLHSQAEAVAQAMTKPEASKTDSVKPSGLAAFPPTMGMLLDQLDYSHLYPPPEYFPQARAENDERSMINNNPEPTPSRSVSSDTWQSATFYPTYQDTMTYGDNQRHTDTDDFWQQHRTTQFTPPYNYESGRYEMQQMTQPAGSTYNPFTSSSQHIYSPYADAFANSGQEVDEAPLDLTLPIIPSYPWTSPKEEWHTHQTHTSHQTGSVPTYDDEINKKIEAVAESMSKLTNLDDEIVKVSDGMTAEDTVPHTETKCQPCGLYQFTGKATEHTVPRTETKRQPCGLYRSATRGRKTTTAQKIERLARAKQLHSAGEQAGPKNIQQTAHGIINAKEICTKEITKAESAKKSPSAAQKTNVTETDEDDSNEAASAAEPGSSANKEEVAQHTQQTGTRARLTPQKKHRGKSAKRYG